MANALCFQARFQHDRLPMQLIRNAEGKHRHSNRYRRFDFDTPPVRRRDPPAKRRKFLRTELSW